MSTMQQTDPAYERGLPSNLYAERMVLGAVLMNDTSFITVAASLAPDDFSLEKHRRIFQRMLDIHGRDERIDRVTLANELMRRGELESVDGLSYLVSLDEGLPELYNLESYVAIVKDKSLLRQVIFTSQELMHRCYLGEEGPADIIGAAQTTLMGLSQSQAKDELLSAAQVFERAEGGLDGFLDPSRRVQGTSTGFLRFDEMTGGFHGGELIILAARPAMGKTALALNVALHIATNRARPQAVAVFSLEMSKESLMTRLICSRARVNQQRFRVGHLDRDERARLTMAASDLFEAPLYIDDSSATTLMDVNAKLQKLTSQLRANGQELGLVVVDYLQLMPTPNLGRSSNRTLEVGALSRGMKLMAKDMDVPFLVLSQLSRAPEQRLGDHRPQLSDLRESGSIEQDADLVSFIFRPEVYQKEREDLRGVAELILAKQRNGPTGKVPLVFLHEYTKFENPADDFIDDTPME
jgi:replicative DNA helicase